MAFYFRKENNYKAHENMVKRVQSLFTCNGKYSNPYASKVPQGSDLTGPITISDTSQEVTNTPYPTYSNHLSGNYHLNK